MHLTPFLDQLSASEPEMDISVSKLLGFETLTNFWRVSVSENLVSKKVSVLVLENLVSEKKKSK